jgi:protocatechuate 3,4-dioxygenase beta subunit
MKQFVRWGICLVALVATGFAQSAPPAGTATVTGVIKVGETPAANIALTLLPDRGGFNRPGGPQPPVVQGGSNFRTTTDAGGQYRFTNIPAGRYRLEAQAEAFVGTRSESLTVTEGQTVTAPDLTLTRGGVITGRVTGQNNRPLIAQRVTVAVVTEDGQTRPFNGGNRFGLETDDRGIYRAYGLPAGRYIVSAGENNGGLGGRGGPPPLGGGRMATRYALTYHPDVIEAAQAAVIELTTGKTAEDVDIKMGEPLKRFAATGRIINSETGQPIAGQTVMAMQTAAGGRGPGGPGGGGAGNVASNVNGEFVLSGLLPGSYAASLGRSFNGGSDYYGNAVPFQIVDSDVSGLVLSVKPGASISGVVVLEGVTDPSQKARLAQTMVMAMVRGNNAGGGQGGRGPSGGNSGRNAVAQVAPDGTFRLSGLTAGTVTLNLNSFGGGAGEVSLMRMESNGAQMPADIQLVEGQQLTGLRLIAGIGNGAIRGQVVVQGALPAGVRLRITARALSGGQMQMTDLNPQGQFRFEGLLPGSYELRLQNGGGAPGGGGGGRGGTGGGRGGTVQGTGNQATSFTLPEVRQTVTVTNGAETPAVLTLTIAQ